MTETTIRTPPTGLARVFFRAPITLYRLHLGRLLGGRFLLLNHVGRVSHQPRQSQAAKPGGAGFQHIASSENWSEAMTGHYPDP